MLPTPPSPQKTRSRKRYATGGASLTRLGLAKTPRSKERGWGPYKSVVRERSVEFNLTLDVQNLRQEVEDLLVARELHRSRALAQRHNPAGSLVQMVSTYYQFLRQGFAGAAGMNRLVEWQQRAFMHEIIDPDIDLGNGLVGVENLIEQNRTYATLLRIVGLDLSPFQVVAAEDCVVIESRSVFHFEVQLQSILGIFPHIATDDRILSRLIGHVASAPASVTFYFNAQSKVCQYQVDVDYVTAFMALLESSKDVDALLGRALIADNCMLGVRKDDTGQRFESLDQHADELDAQDVHSGSDITEGHASGNGPKTRAPADAEDIKSASVTITL